MSLLSNHIASATAIQQPPAALTPPLRLEFLPASSRTVAMEIWQGVESDLRSARMMVSSAWTETWLSHFGKLIPHQFAVAYRGQLACGIGLITQGIGQRNGPIRTRTYHLGTAGEPELDSACVEYNTMLVHPANRLEFQRAIWNWAGQQDNWEEFRLDGFHEDELRDWLSSDPRWKVVTKPARYFDVKVARDNNVDPLSLLGPQTRSSIRRSLRRAGSNQCEWAETAKEAEQIFAELTELHQARWNSDGKPGCYSSRVFHDFHLDLLHRLVPIGLMGLFRVRGDEGTIGCNQVLIDQNRVCIYQSGRILPTDHRLSAGVVVDYMLIEESRRRGFDAVDFLAGDSPHKRRLSTHSTPLAWAVYRRPSLKHSLIDGLRTVKHAIHRTFRSPVKTVDPPKDA